jgi:hypothetical protein
VKRVSTERISRNGQTRTNGSEGLRTQRVVLGWVGLEPLSLTRLDFTSLSQILVAIEITALTSANNLTRKGWEMPSVEGLQPN